MKLSINTTQLQALVSKAVKGASCNKMIPITSMMLIERKENKLRLVTTDANNYLIIMADSEGEDFYAVVPVVLFSQLISKLSTEWVNLVYDEKGFVVNANGDYHIELVFDENGEPVKFPSPYESIMGITPTSKLSLEDIRSILRVNKASLATTLEVPCYTGYYCADRVVTTDTYKLCGNNIHMMDTPILVAPETMALLEVMSEAEVQVAVQDNKILFLTKDCVIYGNLMNGVEDFQIDDISALLNEEFESSCRVKRNAMIEALDRIGLFVGIYDNNSITVQFTDGVIRLFNLDAKGVEEVKCESFNNAVQFMCNVNIEMLESQVKAATDDIITIEYGKPNIIKIVNAEVSQVIALDA